MSMAPRAMALPVQYHRPDRRYELCRPNEIRTFSVMKSLRRPSGQIAGRVRRSFKGCCRETLERW
jgi:hypothetical protein